jgi:hypothetical protein
VGFFYVKELLEGLKKIVEIVIIILWVVSEVELTAQGVTTLGDFMTCPNEYHSFRY